MSRATGSLGDLLRERGLFEDGMRAVRTTLHPQDRSEEFGSLAEVIGHGLLPVYQRMQDGRRLGQAGAVVAFSAEPGGRARLSGLRRLRARRQGIAPGDIVYDYDAAPLLHAFIARARRPFFYDAEELEGLGDLVGRLVVRWPLPLAANVRRADDPGLAIVE